MNIEYIIKDYFNNEKLEKSLDLLKFSLDQVQIFLNKTKLILLISLVALLITGYEFSISLNISKNGHIILTSGSHIWLIIMLVLFIMVFNMVYRYNKIKLYINLTKSYMHDLQVTLDSNYSLDIKKRKVIFIIKSYLSSITKYSNLNIKSIFFILKDHDKEKIKYMFK